MKKLFFLLMFSLACLGVYSQTQSLFSEVLLSSNDLNEEQLFRYNKLQNNSLYKNFHFVSVSPLSEVDNEGVLYINLSFLPCQGLDFQISRSRYTDDENYEWYGQVEDENSECAMNTLKILALNGKYIGHLGFDGRSFELSDLTGGVSVIYETDLPQMVGRKCNVGEDIPIDAPPIQPFGVCEQVITRVLILYTPAAELAVNDIHATAAEAVSQMNDILGKSAISGIGTDIVLAGIEPFSFIEGNNLNQAELNSLAGDTNAQNLRYSVNADIVILLTDGNYPDNLGRVHAIGPIFNSAYAIVEADVATSTFLTFAHECAHLFGARHQTFSIGDSPDNTGPYEHAHRFTAGGFLGTKGRNTVMFGSASDKTIERFSNPFVTFLNNPTGKSNRNNARKIMETASTVGSFYTEATGLMIVEITEDEISVDDCEGGLIELSASAHCGGSPYTYSWYRSLNHINWTFIGTGSTTTLNIAPAPSGGTKTTFYKVVATSAAGSPATQYGQHQIWCPVPWLNRVPKYENNVSIVPNPNMGNMNITITLKDEGFIVAELWSVEGVKVMSLCESVLPQGSTSFTLNKATNLTQGFNFLKVLGSNFQNTQKVIILN